MKNKIAFCFLLYNNVKHQAIWEGFFKQDLNNTHNIYSHIKNIDENTAPWLLTNKAKKVSTEWCGESLVKAWLNLLKKAIEDKSNKFFILVSDQCIPLYNYPTIYKKLITVNKSWLNIDKNNKSIGDIGLQYADQWAIYNRYCAHLLIKLFNTESGKKYLTFMRQANKTGEMIYCPDEIYPINWFLHKLGPKFKEQVYLHQSTFTHWVPNTPHPIVFNGTTVSKIMPKMYRSGALFARKFTPPAAKIVSKKYL
jgi:hypothetical protein